VTERGWRVRLGAEAEKDFVGILRYTSENFGPRQAETYKSALTEALSKLVEGPNVTGSASRDEILPNLRTLRIARRGRPGRHFIMHRPALGRIIEVLRILHDAMDMGRQIPKDID
jgi:toxin ParE1/3/4